VLVSACVQLSESDTPDRKPSAVVTVSTVSNVVTPSLVSSASSSHLSQPMSATPQPTQPPSVSPQPAMDTVDGKGASPAPENKESTE